MSAIKSVSSRLAAAAISIAALGSTVCADPLGLAEPMRNPGMIFDNVVRDQGSDPGLPTHLRRQVVAFSGSEAPGTILIDTANTYLYYVLGGGRAIRYAIGVGRDGFTWSGVQRVSRMAEWPDWIPPPEMIKRQQYLPRWVAGGPGNPLGARAIYLGNTQYRIHGTNDPTSIGKQVSSGCIRLTNEDVIDLYGRVTLGAKVVVLPAARHAPAERAVLGREHQVPAPPPNSTASVPTSRAGAFAFGLY